MICINLGPSYLIRPLGLTKTEKLSNYTSPPDPFIGLHRVWPSSVTPVRHKISCQINFSYNLKISGVPSCAKIRNRDHRAFFLVFFFLRRMVMKIWDTRTWKTRENHIRQGVGIVAQEGTVFIFRMKLWNRFVQERALLSVMHDLFRRNSCFSEHLSFCGGNSVKQCLMVLKGALENITKVRERTNENWHCGTVPKGPQCPLKAFICYII